MALSCGHNVPLRARAPDLLVPYYVQRDGIFLTPVLSFSDHTPLPPPLCS